MSGISTNPKVLLCTAYRRFPNDYWDLVGGVVYNLPRVSIPRRSSLGLRFIKQNVPQVEILEHPMWPDYVKKLKEGWDVVGFSLFQNEVGEITRMAAEARRQGIRELWAGGYGAMEPAIARTVDRVVLGAGEDEVAQMFGYRVKEVVHPAMAWAVNFLPGTIPYMKMGLIYSRHGCPYRCTFCQTPVFDVKSPEITLESIERVLRYYAGQGFTDLYIADELFGLNPRRTAILTEMFARYRFRWWAQTRISLFLKHLDDWYERGLRFPSAGVESLSDRALSAIDKRQQVEPTFEFARRTAAMPGVYRTAYYMLGYENMTLEETLEDAVLLKQAGFDAHGLSVITPFPATLLWDELDAKYGIFDTNHRHYDTHHMVWNHPHISPSLMHYLRARLISYLNNPVNIYAKKFTRLIRDRFRAKGLEFLWRDLIKGPLAAAFYDERKQVFFPQDGHSSGSLSMAAPQPRNHPAVLHGDIPGEDT